MIWGVDAKKLGRLVASLMAAGISPRGLNNVLWVIKHRHQLQLFLYWLRRN